MAYDAKASFLGQLQAQLADVVTAAALGQVLQIAGTIIDGFDVVEHNGFTGAHEEDLLQCYLDALKVEGRSAKTIWRYRYVITRMLQSVGVPTRRITVYHLRAYLAAEQERGVKESTTEGLRQVFSAYFNWLQRESLIERNPAANLGAIKCAKRRKQTFTDADMENLKSCCTTLRDKSIVCFLAATGCRISEVTALNREQINFAGLEVVVHGKGNKERKVYLNSACADVLRKYFATRKDDNPALFVGKGAKRLQPGGVRVMLKGLEAASGVEHVHPHKFRRTLATDMSRRGMPIQEIANILGHDKIDTTMMYVVLNDDDVKNAYRKFA